MSAIFWIAGGFAEGHSRLVLWAVALAIEYISPAVRFWIPKYGASSVGDWVVEGGHMAERCAGFIIIALGESLSSPARRSPNCPGLPKTVGAFMSAFVGAIAMWWIYFHKGAEAGSELISRSSEPGRLARLAYTYLHMPIVAGIILSAVADELVLTHPAVIPTSDGAERDRRAAAVSDRNDSVQAHHSRLASTVAWRRHRCARRPCLVRRRLSPLMLSF
jgi:low temperature requirement protein LtrA